MASGKHIFMSEKSGVVDRIINNVYTKSESEEIARKSKEILAKCSGKSDKEIQSSIFGNKIKIIYHPIEDDNKPLADASADTVRIFREVTDDNYENMRYVLIHELTHVLQQIKMIERSGEYSKSPLNAMWTYISYALSINTNNVMDFTRETTEGKLAYVIYRLRKEEEYAWSNNMYIEAVREQENYMRLGENPDKMTIFKKVMNKRFIGKKQFNGLIDDIIDGSEIINKMIVSDLVSFFNELKRAGIGYCHFDKEVFTIPEVVKLRNTFKKIILSGTGSEEDLYKLDAITDKFLQFLYDKRLDVLDKIKTCFIKRMITRYNECYKRFTKAILLGIEDAKAAYSISA